MMSLDDLFKFFNISDSETEVTTVNGWVMENTDKIPEVNDCFDYDKLHLEVIETDGRRASKVRITEREQAQEEE